MDINASSHGPAHILDGSRISNSGSVVVYEVFLELLDLLFIEHHFGKFADSRIDSVHDFPCLNFLLQHGPANLYSLQSFGVQFHFFTMPGNTDQSLNGQR